MSTSEKLNELNTHHDELADSTARQRIKSLLDTNSFVELGAFVTHRSTDFNLPKEEVYSDGVVTGYGTIDARLVYVYSQDISVLNGSIGEMNSKKIGKIYELALKMGAPVIGILDSKGVRLQEGLDSFEGYGKIFKYQTIASGVIPQISIILGDCLGINSIIAGLSDFVFMEQQKSKMFINSPNTMEGLDGKTATFEQIGSSKTHSEQTGLAHFCYETEELCLQKAKELLNFLPSNNLEDAPLHGVEDDLNRVDKQLNDLIDLDEFDIKAVINSISDNSYFLEIKENYSKNIVTGFTRFNGYTAAIIANQNKLLDIKGCNKAIEFINFCDSFNIPIISLTNVCGYKSALDEELNGLLKYISKLIYSFTHSTVPKINIIIKQALASPYIAMNSKHIGADIVYSWPNTEIGLMSQEAYEKIVNEQIDTSPYIAAKRNYIDDIIEPSETRKYIISALEMLESKRETRPAKKHSSIL